MLASLVLDFLLFFAFTLAPVMTNAFFLASSQSYKRAHVVAALLAMVALCFDLRWLAFIWPLFCAYGVLLFLQQRLSQPRRLALLGAEAIPFLFSLISAVWFVSGMNDFHLLGYDRTWSFYAALHGAYLGWLLIGCFAFLARRSPAFHLSCYLFLVFFLLVAFGINGVPYVKKIGVIGISLGAPLLVSLFVLRTRNARARTFGLVSLCAILISMALAVLNEFSTTFPRALFGSPTMIVTHGLLNGLIAVPCFFLAVRYRSTTSLPS